jgi:hypothetical protein
MSDVNVINSNRHNINYDESLDKSYWQSDIFVREKNLVDHLKKVFYFLDEREILGVIHGLRK